LTGVWYYDDEGDKVYRRRGLDKMGYKGPNYRSAIDGPQAHICHDGLVRKWAGFFCSLHRPTAIVLEVVMSDEEIAAHNERVRAQREQRCTLQTAS
jgi:hypothetical protein